MEGWSYSLWWPIQEGSVRKGYLFQASGIYQRVGILAVEVWERVTIISFNERPKGADKWILSLCAWESWRNVLVLWFIHISNTVPLQQLKGMESSNYTGYMKGQTRTQSLFMCLGVREDWGLGWGARGSHGKGRRKNSNCTSPANEICQSLFFLHPFPWDPACAST